MISPFPISNFLNVSNGFISSIIVGLISYLKKEGNKVSDPQSVLRRGINKRFNRDVKLPQNKEYARYEANLDLCKLS